MSRVRERFVELKGRNKGLISEIAFLCSILLSCGCGKIWGGVSSTTPPVSIAGYNGVMLVQAFGDAPNAPPGTPTSRIVNFTWPEFTVGSPNYALLRVQRNGTLITGTPSNCTANQSSECLVCTKSFGAVTHTCSDSTIGVSPAQYDYIVTIQKSDGSVAIPYPSQPYRVTVAIPPANMVLVQQDAVNLEMCNLLGQTSDPLNHQRCPYSGLGAVPYNINPGSAPLNLPANYYDFGYNIFVDRWTPGCKWTNTANGGMCGAGPAAGNCYGQADPTNGTQGVDGNVYYNTNSGQCFVNSVGTWINLHLGVLTNAQMASSYTIDPGSGSGKNPPIVNTAQTSSWNVCRAIQDPNYGPKRLMRHREFIAASAWPSLNGEPGALTQAQIANLQAGTGHTPGNYSCDGDNAAGIALGPFTSNNLAGDSAGGGITAFVAGSIETSQCLSRFGAQDIIGSDGLWVSDQLAGCSGVTHTCNGITSALDSGNTDLSHYNFDGVVGPGALTGGQVGPNYTFTWAVSSGVVGGLGAGQGYGAAYFNFPLGLPLMSSDGYSPLISSNTSVYHNETVFLYSDDGNVARGLVVGNGYGFGTAGGRWVGYWTTDPTGVVTQGAIRCALPAP